MPFLTGILNNDDMKITYFKDTDTLLFPSTYIHDIQSYYSDH